ncbi:toll-like receptor Tollo [Mizuhopecten yessoensis]|uniref:Protein toll n=1 Tax=Mizuhopecten yessoensis TaxID=6573 RepID=A0A210QZ32_MIZYE|nr:toll-like receptor Tollo [Mizuhopecten yessoensis]XP_021345911.1 toll-like receptor Tollo [Mizuhopecten yessoensis]OWF53952.1 Protein toll [Mizuhopecten yessoensis]
MPVGGSVYRCLWLLLAYTHLSFCWLKCNNEDQPTHTLNQTLSFLNETLLDICRPGAYNLSAADNTIRSLTEMSFKKNSGLCVFYNLKGLYLTNNNIDSIDDGTFSCFRRLKTLDLSYNNMVTLPHGIFDDLYYLDVLDLSYNSIQDIDSSVFGHNKLISLTEVYLQSNKLHTFEPWAYVLQKIVIFDLQNNSISNFSNTIGWKFDLTESSLAMVNLRDNKMTDWRDDFLLQYHPSGDVAVDIQSYKIDFRNNPWNCDCHVHNIVSKFQSSFYMHVRGELLQMKCKTPYQLYNEDMMYIPRLKELVCNITTDCPESCLCQKQPENQILIVDCSRRGFRSLPLQLPPLSPNYTYVLNFSYNSIAQVTKRSYMHAIQILDMQGNSLQEIELLAISETRNLKFIDLKNNYLKSIPNTMQKIVFEKTDLGNNPFVCSCDMTWMAEWIKRSPVDTRGRDMKCTFEEEEQFAIMQVTNSLLDCSYDLVIGLAVGFGVLLVVVVVIVVWAKQCPYETKVLLYRFFGFHPRDRYIVDKEVGTESDIYVSFDDENIHIRQWVLMKLAAKLEPTYKMFIPIRDLPVGNDRAEETITHLERSKRIIIVLSDRYDKHEWCAFECQRAEILDFNEGRIIYIKYHDSVAELLNEEPWRSRVKNRKMFSPGGMKSEKRLFWDKLKYELPIVLKKDRNYYCAV